jgi:hypothetical protein
MQRAKHSQDGLLRHNETVSTLCGNGAKKKWLLSRDSVLVQTPPLQVAPKYIPAFYVLDEDAGLETASIRRNGCKTKDADSVRKTPELTVRGSRSGVRQALFLRVVYIRIMDPSLPVSLPCAFNMPIRLSFKSFPHHLTLVKWSRCNMIFRISKLSSRSVTGPSTKSVRPSFKCL